jgi:peptidyl-prolyl cis-trans isomerase B (cyclophilin B)
MKKQVCILFLILTATALLAACKKDKKDSGTPIDQFEGPQTGDTVAEIVVKDFGSIFVYFFEEAAPKAVENFVTHAKNGYYDGLTFHRIIDNFMIQGGDPTGTGRGGESIWNKDFEDEFSPYLQPYRGALCMANAGRNTNGSQFFLVQSTDTYDNSVLSQIETYYGFKFSDAAKKLYAEVGGTPWLYRSHTVFGQIYEGYDVLDAIAKVPKADEENGVPKSNVIIETIKVFEYE